MLKFEIEFNLLQHKNVSWGIFKISGGFRTFYMGEGKEGHEF